MSTRQHLVHLRQRLCKGVLDKADMRVMHVGDVEGTF